jgi:outer membrane lipoprotein-sorting protein
VHKQTALIVFLATNLFFFSTCLAQTEKQASSSLKDIIENVKMATKKIDTFKAGIETEILTDNAPMISRGEISFKRPRNVRLRQTSEVSMPENPGEVIKQEQIMVDNGKFLWIYMPPPAGFAFKVYETEKSSPPPGMEFVEPFRSVDEDSLTLTGRDELEGKGCYILEGKIKGVELSSGRKLVKLWIGISNNLPYRIKFYNSTEDNKAIITFLNPEINKVIDDSEFDFSPPPGTPIEEIK